MDKNAYLQKNTIDWQTLLLLSIFMLSHTGPLVVRSATPGGDTADTLSQPSQYTCVITCILQFREGPVMIIIYYFPEKNYFLRIF